MTVTDLLREIERLDLPHCRHSGRVSPVEKPGPVVDSLLCVDGATWFDAPPDIAEFCAYGTPWSLCTIQLEWPDISKMPALLATPRIAELIDADFDRGLLLVDEATKANSVLFAYDDLNAIFQRAYIVFTDPLNYFVLDAGSEIARYDTIGDYLAFWKDVVAI